jgi:hypothetical protein
MTDAETLAEPGCNRDHYRKAAHWPSTQAIEEGADAA